MTDRIEIRALRVLCHVGVGGDERASAQPLELDIDLELSLRVAAESDDVGDTVDYGEVSIAVASAVQATDHALLERVAAVAADAALGVDDRRGRDRGGPQAAAAHPARRRLHGRSAAPHAVVNAT